MTPKQKRIAIAEACGYSDFGSQAVSLIHDRLVMWCEKSQKSIPLPDYPNDLNAMHEAEKTLLPMQKVKYILILAELTNPPHVKGLADCIFASAAARANAFLLVLGKLEVSP